MLLVIGFGATDQTINSLCVLCAIGHVRDDECGTDIWVASISNNQKSWSHLLLYSYPVAICTQSAQSIEMAF